MKHVSNEQKAKEIAENIVGNDHYSYFDTFKQCAMQAMQWKDEQHAKEKQQWIDKATGCKEWITWLEKQGERSNIVEQLTAFAVHLNKRGAFREDLFMDFDHEAQSFIEMQKPTELC